MPRSLETFIQTDVQPLVDMLRNMVKRNQSLWKRMQQSLDSWDMDGINRQVEAMSLIPQAMGKSIKQLQDTIARFDLSGYLLGDFDEEFLNACRAASIPVQKLDPLLYEVFPFLVRIDPETRTALLNDRKLAILRPTRLVLEIKKEREMLYQRTFHARRFLRYLMRAYIDLLLQQEGKTRIQFKGVPILLKRIYRSLTPMRQWEQAYPIRFFAFDLYRLLESGEMEIDGKVCRLGSTRDIHKAIRVVDASGKERYYGTLSFSESIQ